ncbi:nuclear pore complex protein Nup98-Nup96 [Marchantia polymorpha subsp. ruderalis]|uniref:Nucleoporin autopeptidase n=1 Tax=Marchantia polymorpha TaxID=3197 RepID=A0A2R6X9E5_MARPO|nr:hypothetical protein MARPO_0028s0046 [Marchantia polymorpha]BBN00670.1 hypothetical protein Mp_2g01050 [Marchantia polymorpha subsp. ruderalis]|eukprot:PTQ42726.1 hypothetical protein MARPO_0028s0046 [Marchantia polymorpha]
MAMFGSSSPFGASSPSPFGGTTASSNPFGTTGQSNPFGVTQAANPFGAKPFGTSPFGQTGGSLFGSGTATGVFGSTQPAGFGASSSAFGASASAPAFGSTASPFGSGAPVFGQKPAGAFGGFGTTPAQANPFGTPFGQTQAAFGSQPFGSTPSAFGAASAPAFGTTPTTAFGSSAPAFGASSAPAFGATTSTPFGSSAPAFGSNSVFGQTASAFGASSSSAFGSSFGAPAASPFGAPSGSAFGASASPSFGATSFGASPFGGQRVGSRVAAYAVTNDPDVGVGGQTGKFMSISAMAAYSSKSPEELRWEDYQAGDKGGPNPTAQQPATGGIFGQSTPQSPFGASTGGFGQQQQTSAPNPFATPATPSIFGQKPVTGFGASSGSAFGASSAPAFGQAFGQTQSPFASPSTGSAFGQASASAFGASSPSPFGAASGAAFGSTGFGSAPLGTSAFGGAAPFTGSAFTNLSSPATLGSSSPFGSAGFFGQSQPAGALFATPSSQGFGTSAPAFGASNSSFGTNIFNTGGTASIFSQTKPAGLTQSTSPSPFSNFGQTTSAQPSFSFPSFQASQPGGSSIFNGSSGLAFGQNAFAQPQPANNVMMAMPQPVTNPFGTLPAMPQMSIGRSAGSGPSVQYGISSMPVSDKPTQVRTTSLLTPRHITQRSKIRMHARRYHPKKDSPKVSFFSDGEETPSTPKADVLFVPRENPRALFIRQPEQTLPASTPVKGTPDARDIATPLHRNGEEVEDQEASMGPNSSPPDPESPLESWPNSDVGDTNLHTPPSATKPAEKGPTIKSISKVNGVREEHNHRGNGYISITGHRAGEAAIAYEHGADIEALMPKLRHSDYFTEPRIQELAAKERAEPGYCRRVHDFVVGRRAYGAVKFLGDTDVRRLDLESIIQFNKCEVLVYMDESRKPPVGQQLNKPAEVTLLNVKCVDKKTGQHFTEGTEVEKFEKRLKKKTEEQGAEFISYDALKGEWKFQVKHFSRYGLDDSDEEETPQPGSSRALALTGTDMMEGVEGGSGDFLPKSPELGEEVAEIDEDDEGPYETHSVAPQAALPHSLPSQLRLDPLKMQQMRALFFPLGEEDEPALSGLTVKPRTAYTRQTGTLPKSKIATSGEKVIQDSREEGVRAAWPHRSPWKGGPTKQMRLSPHNSWKPSSPYSPVPASVQSRPFVWGSDLEISPVGNGIILALPSADDVSCANKHKDVGFSIEFDKLSESVVAGRYDHIVDAGLFFGRSFRVGWGPNGMLVHSGSPVTNEGKHFVLSSNFHMEKVALDSTIRDDEGQVVDELVQLQFVSPLTLHMTMSKVVDYRQDAMSERLKLRKVVCTRAELSRICDEYEDLIYKQHGVKGLPGGYQLVLRHQVMVWQLLDVLFSEREDGASARVDEVQDESAGTAKAEEASELAADPDTELLGRRAEFSRWLQTSVSHLVQEDLRLMEEEDEMKEIFFLLTGRQVDAAVLKASFRGDVRLACLLSQAGGSVMNRIDIATQLDVWTSEGLDLSLIEDERLNVYKLLAGDVWGALDNHNIDWKRFLGLLMWYQLPPDTDLPTIISTYQELIVENKLPLPIPMYQEEGEYTDANEIELYDTSYYLMLLHASKKKQFDDTKKMLSSASTTFDRLDHRLAWHQQGFLEAVHALEPLELHELHMNFAAQLLAAGVCHWAIYVVLHIPANPEFPGLHEKVIKEILCQYCESWSNSSVQQTFLEQELGIPAEWLHGAQAVYFHYVGDSKLELEHLMKSHQWHCAQTLFMTDVAATMFINAEHSDVWRLVSQLEHNKADLENFELGAGIFFDFYNLKTNLSSEDDVMEEMDTLEKQTSACKAFFLRLKESERLWNRKVPKNLRLAYSQMADDLAILLLAESKVRALDNSEELKSYDAVLDAPLPEHVKACRLQGAVSAFTSWLSETAV